jgi:3-hydroxyisobutyrate dehydrogenase-like beta-hydroxyacid dehydrogenase
MGSRMARRLLDAGHTVRVYDPVRAATDALVEAGASVATSPGDASRGAELVLCSLPDPDAVEEAILGADGVLWGAAPGTTIVDMTTSDPDTSRRVARRSEAQQVRFLDAPVSHGLVGAETGTLAMMIGGDEQVLEDARPVLGVLANDIVHVGPVGAGQIAKLCNNMLAAIHAAALGEVLAAGLRAGIGLRELTASISKSSGTSFILEHYFPRGLFTAERPTTFALSLMRKDLSLFMRASYKADASVPLSAFVQQLYTAAGTSIGEDADWSSVAELYERLAGVDLRLPISETTAA